jgi:hypothetical protein
MLTQVEEGKIFLEDEDAHIELDLTAAVKIYWMRAAKIEINPIFML